MNTKVLSGTAIVKRMKLQNTVGKQIVILAGISRNLLKTKAGSSLRGSKKLYTL